MGIADMKDGGKSRSKRISMLMAVLFLLVTICVLSPVAGADENRAASKLPISSGSEIDYPPFCILDAAGNADGFSVELLRAALAAMGRKVTFRTGPWEQVRTWLEQGEIQALPLVGRTPEREQIFDFTFPYMSLYGAIVVRRDTTGIQDLSDLKGRQVAVMKGDNAEEFLRREDRGIGIHTTATFQDALRELSDGRSDAVVIQRLVGLRLIQETGATNLRIVNSPLKGFRQDFCFAVQEGDRATLALLNEGLALVMADGTYRRLHTKWFAALELPSNGRIIVGGDYNYPPYEYLDENGRPAGFDVDLTRAIAQEMNLDIEIRLGPWSEAVEGLEKEEIDAIEGMFYSPERDLKFDFTPPYLVNQYVSVVRRGEGAPPATIQELKDKRIVLQKGDVIYDFAVKNGLQNQLTVVETQEDVLRELAQGRHDCALVVRVSALYLLHKHKWTNLTLGKHSFLSREYCYAVPNNHKALLSHFEEGLKVLNANGEYRRIYNKWLGIYEKSPPGFAAILRYVAMTTIPLAVLLSVFFLWSW
jgi:ABC-type amino acid transport substrate-binding protein